MKRKYIIFLILAFSICFGSQSFAADVKVKLASVFNNKGYIFAGICPEKGFLKKYKDCRANVKIRALEGSLEFVFENIPNGKYAIMAYHDENNNGKLDTNFLGIPKEGYGFSNNAKGKFSAPSFEKASFDVINANLEQKINMIY